jgi:hypothetical protein
MRGSGQIRKERIEGWNGLTKVRFRMCVLMDVFWNIGFDGMRSLAFAGCTLFGRSLDWESRREGSKTGLRTERRY